MTCIDDAQTQRSNMAFIRSSMRQPMLERLDEFALARRWREHGDERALHALVASHARLTIAFAARFRHYGLPTGDLVQEGNVGLMQAASRFDPDRQVRFSTYAAWWIRSAMQDYILRNWSIVRTGSTAAQKSLFFNLRRLRAKIASNPSNPLLNDEERASIAAVLDVAPDEVATMEMRLAQADQSLNSPLSEGTEQAEFQDFLADDRPSPEEAAIGMRDEAARTRWLAEALRDLSPRERHIIAERRLTEDAVTLEDLGKTMGISKERVRQLEHRAMAKLRTVMLSKAKTRDSLFG
jgi:RNA polymerase sigma-32 factor